MTSDVIDLNDAEDKFLDEMARHDLDLGDKRLVGDGRWHRCTATNKSGKNDKGSYVLHLDGWPRGSVRNFTTESEVTKWVYKPGRKLTKEERDRLKLAEEENEKEREEERRRQQERHERVAAYCRREWEAAGPADPDHPYLQRKGVGAYGLRQKGDLLLVPAVEDDGKIWTIQRISPAAGAPKLFVKNSRAKFGLHVIEGQTDIVFIAEGYATAATIFEITRCTVVVAFEAGKLRLGAERALKTWPKAQVVIAADDDWTTEVPPNPGMTSARNAATLLKLPMVKPDFTGVERGERDTDFNDMRRLRGADAVNEALSVKAGEPEKQPADGEPVTLDDFYAYMPSHNYIFVPTGDMWPARSVNSRVSIGSEAANQWLDKNRAVEQMTWAPGLPKIIRDRLVADGGWIERAGVSCFNLYRPPNIRSGDPNQAGPWLDHVRRVYPDHADRIVKWLAHRVQRPGEKINHAVVLGGPPGIGKDSIVEPVKRAVGAWNCQEVSPSVLLGRFTGFLKSVILRVSEARDMGDVNRYALYDHMKAYLASPPDVLRVDEKNIKEYAVVNVVGVIITTNYQDALYLPADDRRHYVAWSEVKPGELDAAYFDALWTFYNGGGDRHVAAYLGTLDLSSFDPKAPPPKTAAFWAAVDAGRSSEDAALEDVIEKLGTKDKVTEEVIKPDAVTFAIIARAADADLASWVRDRKNQKIVAHRIDDCGYERVRNPGSEKGLWKIGGKWQAAYAKKELSIRDRLAAVARLVDEEKEAAKTAKAAKAASASEQGDIPF